MEHHHRRGDSASRSSRRGLGARKGRPRRPGLEALESRELLSMTEFTALPSGSQPVGIASGGGYLWVAESSTNQIARIDPSDPRATPVQITASSGANPYGIVVDPQGRVWFTEDGLGQIGMYNPSNPAAGVTEYQLPDSTGHYEQNATPVGITVGPDGNIWFTEQEADVIGMIDPNTAPQSGGIVPVSAGAVTVYSSGLANTSPAEIIGADGKLWITEAAGNQIGEFNPSDPGAGVTPITLTNTTNPATLGIALGSDGNLWVAERNPQGSQHDALVRINPNQTSEQTQFATPDGSGAFYVTAGSDGNIWLTEGNQQVGMINPNSSAPQIQAFSTGNSNSATNQIAVGPDGNIWFTDQGTGNFGVLPTTQLVVSTPSGVVAGDPFTVTVTDQNLYASGTDTSYDGSVRLELASGPGSLAGTLTAQATNGVATFPNLTLNQAGSYVIQANGGIDTGQSNSFTATPTPTSPTPTPTSPTPTPTSPTPTPTSPTPTPTSPTTTPTPAPPTPTIVSERIVQTYLKHNKKGKPIGKPVVEVVLTFSTAMNPGSVDSTGNYQVEWASTKKVRKQVQTTLHPITVVSATSDATDTVVTLVTSAQKTKFAKGGQVSIVSPASVLGAAGGSLGGTTVFVISPKAGGISPA